MRTTLCIRVTASRRVLRGAPVQKSPGGYRYLSGMCTGETTGGHFHTDAGTSCCWTPGEWFASVGFDLTRAIVCFRDESRVDALLAEAGLEVHPLWVANK